jgi:hypothetical protein
VVLVAVLAQLGYRYNCRDLFSHWIRKDQPERRPCTHACCRGLRAHPESYPVAKRNAYLRHASDAQLADLYAWQLAEADTKGNMLNRRGREAGINERTLFTGPSLERGRMPARNCCSTGRPPRPTAAMFEGWNTRVAAAGQAS